MTGYLLFFAAALAGVVGHRSRFARFFVLTACWLIMAFNTSNADFAGYEYFYEFRIEEWSGLNPGYVLSERVAWALGFDFLQYRMMMSTVALLLIAWFVNRYTRNGAIVLSLYLLLPFLYDVVQFKFFISAAIALFALRFLIDRVRFFALKYAIAMLLAYSVHPASVLFTFLLVGLLGRGRSARVSFAITVVIFLLVYTGIAQAVLSGLTDSIKAEAYFAQMSRFGSIPYLISVGLQVFIVYITQSYTAEVFEKADRPTLSVVRCGEGHAQEGQDDAAARFLSFFDSAVYSFLPIAAFIPLSIQNFYRPIRSASILFFIYFAIMLFEQRESLSDRGRTFLVLAFSVWMIGTVFLVYYPVLDLVVAPELTNNLLWS
ncbi:EpsG family protein [Adlercreutzia sp. ZJ473]|uniref:EpsG family protein n=1 Tax=Adlercreutzia sp. ZJ473 TaxID=2722822 RepID=UPI001552935D|nr:EpsG family protein [Adlercreutzia sp. ZJ473]